jgi:hypothetical protein
MNATSIRANNKIAATEIAKTEATNFTTLTLNGSCAFIPDSLESKYLNF